MLRPTMVTICEDERVVIELGIGDSQGKFLRLGFKKNPDYDNVYVYDSAEPKSIHALCEVLRDMGVPYATHRHMGADYQLKWLRDKGYVHGVFKRINFFGNDNDENAPFAIEEF